MSSINTNAGWTNINPYKSCDPFQPKDAKPLKPEEDPLCLKEAMRAYQQKMLTGEVELTDEEKEEIKNRIEEYIKTHREALVEAEPVKQSDIDAFKGFLEKLYRTYGSKKDFFDFAMDITLNAADLETAGIVAELKMLLENFNFYNEDKLMLQTGDSDEDRNIIDVLLSADMFHEANKRKANIQESNK